MATCNDCLHIEVCKKKVELVETGLGIWDEYRNLKSIEHLCNHFKNKVDCFDVPQKRRDR